MKRSGFHFWEAKKIIPIGCLFLTLTVMAGNFVFAVAEDESSSAQTRPQVWESFSESSSKEDIEYTILVVDGKTQTKIDPDHVEIFAADGEKIGERECGDGKKLTFHLPSNGDWQVKVSAEGYDTGHGLKHTQAQTDIEETVELYPVVGKKVSSFASSENSPVSGSSPVSRESVSEPAARTTDSSTPASMKTDPSSNADKTSTSPQVESGSPEPSAQDSEEPEETGTESTKPWESSGEESRPEESSETSDSKTSQEDGTAGESTPTSEASAGETASPELSSSEDVPVTEDFLEYPPAWADSDPVYMPGNIGMAEEIRILEKELQDRLKLIRAMVGIPEETKITYDADNWADIWAIYAWKREMTENYPYNVELPDEDAKRELRSIFWTLTCANGVMKSKDGENIYDIRVERKKYSALMEEFFSEDEAEREEQERVMMALTDTENRSLVYSQMENSILSRLDEEDFEKIQENLKGVYGQARAVLLAGLALEGKVQYFWGGKSAYVGWDDRWGELRTVSAAGSRKTGTVQILGLDCSGFVTWAFVNACGDRSVEKYIGHGTTEQWRLSQAIEMEDVQPGDLLFYANPKDVGYNNHIGIAVGRDEEGQLKVVHCSSGADGVTVTGLQGFRYARRPYIYT